MLNFLGNEKVTFFHLTDDSQRSTLKVIIIIAREHLHLASFEKAFILYIKKSNASTVSYSVSGFLIK